jgi:hypothetical protein
MAATLFALVAPFSASASENASVSTGIRTSSTDISTYAQILHDGTNWTMIPRGAVLHLSDKHRDKLGERPVGNLVSWPEFLSINRSWLATEEVTLRQAEGTRAIDPRRLSYFSKQKRMVVAVHQESPIAVVFIR